MAVTLPFEATVSVTARANIRQGSPSMKAPVLRRIDVKTELAVHGICAGDEVAGNPHWWSLDNGGFIWAGVCSDPVAATAATVPAGTITANSATVAPTAAAGPTTTGAASGVMTGSGSPPISRDLARYGFEPEFADRLGRLLDACTSAGYEFRVAQGVRPPQTQALYYCEWEKRTPAMVGATADRLAGEGAPWLASLLRKLRNVDRISAWQTDQLPGSGWHQWGEAADCYCYRNGVQVGNGNDPAYRFYADKAREIGLTPGYYFHHQDAGHVQLRPQAGASDLYGWPEIDVTMRGRFGQSQSLTYDAGVETVVPGYAATRARVSNRGLPPVAFLDELVAWGRAAREEIFDAPDRDDVYVSVQQALGPYGDIDQRRVVMLEIMRVLAGFESSWNWRAGRDTTNPTSDRPETTEAGAWQVSANSMGFGSDLKELVRDRLGTLDPLAFQKGMKEDHTLAMEYVARLLRHTVRANGPVLRHEIDQWLRRDAVAEFQRLLAAPQ